MKRSNIKRSIFLLLGFAGCARPASQEASPRPTTSVTSPTTSTSSAESCDAIFGAPSGGEKLCDEHVRSLDAEIHWQSYAVAEARATLNARYHERASRCQLPVMAQPPQFSIARGSSHLSTHEATPVDYPTCSTKASSWHKTVVIVSTKTDMRP